MILFLIFDGGKLADVVLVAEFDISIINVDERSFFIRTKEHVFPIVMDSFEGLDAVVIEIRRAYICSAVISTSKVLLEQKMVSCSDVVVFVGLNAPLCVFYIEVELF